MKVELTLDSLTHTLMFLDNLTDGLTPDDDGVNDHFGLKAAFAMNVIRMIFTDQIVESLTLIASADVQAIIDELQKARADQNVVSWNRWAGDLWTVCREARDAVEPLV